jgi:predicted ABC-class ATPase
LRWLRFSIDKQGNIYAANTKTPVIRKYSPGGKMLTAITFETPLDIPVEITLNKTGDEIERKEEAYNEDKVKIIRMEKGSEV